MGTKYRCACPKCTAYIDSDKEPTHAADSTGFIPYEAYIIWERFWTEWNAECRVFMAGPCPHKGQGIQSLWEFRRFDTAKGKD